MGEPPLLKFMAYNDAGEGGCKVPETIRGQVELIEANPAENPLLELITLHCERLLKVIKSLNKCIFKEH